MGYLTLENGQFFEGNLFGSIKDKKVIGEILFNTGMTGYESVISDKANYGKLVVLTYPLIGNYGVNHMDMGGEKSGIKGLIVREMCEVPSNWRAEKPLEQYLKENDIFGIQGLDTRNISKIIIEHGAMNAMISEELPTEKDIQELKKYTMKVPIETISTKESYNIKGIGKRVAVIDLGVRMDFIESLKKRNLDITVLPFTQLKEDNFYKDFDGIIISDGPSNPYDLTDLIPFVSKIIGNIPLLGIGLGHYLIAIATGANLTKLKYGHRGNNQPIKCTASDKMFITSQNHSFVVEEKSLPNGAEVVLTNWNDNTIEGIRYNNKSCIGIQFYPETISGVNDAKVIIDNYINIMENNGNGQCKS